MEIIGLLAASYEITAKALKPTLPSGLNPLPSTTRNTCREHRPDSLGLHHAMLAGREFGDGRATPRSVHPGKLVERGFFARKAQRYRSRPAPRPARWRSTPQAQSGDQQFTHLALPVRSWQPRIRWRRFPRPARSDTPPQPRLRQIRAKIREARRRAAGVHDADPRRHRGDRAGDDRGRVRNEPDPVQPAARVLGAC